jgi:hypothetical protein
MKETKDSAEGQGLTAEQRIAELEAQNEALKGDLKKAKAKAKTAAAEEKPKELIFEVDEVDDDGNETGEVLKYRFTCPRFNIDNVEYTAEEVIKSENEEVIAKLVAIKSGIVELVD